MRERIYLDHAATTPVRQEVLDAMLPHFTSGYNASSQHAEGRSARAALDEARERTARLLGAKPKEVVFTGGGSEADNLAILGTARALRARGRHVVSAVTEHHAVLHALDALRDDGFDVTLLPVDGDGRIEPDAFERALRPDTTLATIAYANNEIGVVAPIARLAAVAHAAGVLFHTDAVQAPAYLPLDVRDLGVDLLSIAAHKFYGPKGVGALYVREGTPLEPIVHGGGQEFAKRAGTENVAGIVGLATAFELAAGEREYAARRIGALRDHLEAEAARRIPGIRFNGAGATRLPNNSSVAIGGVDSEPLLLRLDLDGVAVSAGSACAAGAVEPSHVIAALNLPPELLRGVIRFSLGHTTRQSQVDEAVAILERAVSDLRSISGIPA